MVKFSSSSGAHVCSRALGQMCGADYRDEFESRPVSLRKSTFMPLLMQKRSGETVPLPCLCIVGLSNATQPYSIMRADEVYFPYFAITIPESKPREELVWGITVTSFYLVGDDNWSPAFLQSGK
jgi:hypothetical protein